jgi:hypothetical protein
VVALKKIDELIDLFEMKETNYRMIEPTVPRSRIDDFDRIFLTLRNINSVYLSCLIEDYKNQESAFLPALSYLRFLYSSILNYLPNQPTKNIIELKRCRAPSGKNLVESESIEINYLKSLDSGSDPVIQYLINSSNNNLALLYATILIWENWLESNYKMTLLNRRDFVKGVLLNYFILSNIKPNRKTDPNFEIIIEYKNLIDSSTKNTETHKSYFQNDLKSIHSLSEFQAIYFTLGALVKYAEMHNVNYLSPSHFFNAFFILKYIQRNALSTVDENNNSIPNSLHESISNIETLIDSNDALKKSFLEIQNGYSECKEATNRLRLISKVSNLKL